MSIWDDIISGLKNVLHDVENIVDYTEEELEDLADSIGCVFSGNLQGALADLKKAVVATEEQAEDELISTFNSAWNEANSICNNCLAPFGATGYFIKIAVGGIGMYVAKTSDGWVTISSNIQADFENYVTNTILSDFSRAVGAVDLSQYSGYEGTASFTNKPVMVIDTQGVDKITFGYAGSIYYSQGGADIVTFSQTQPLPGIITLVNNVTLIGKLNNDMTTVSNLAATDNLQLKSLTTVDAFDTATLEHIPCFYDSEADEHATCKCVSAPDENTPWATVPVPYGFAGGNGECEINGPIYRLDYAGISIGSPTLANAFGKIDEGGVSIYSPIQPFYLLVVTDNGYGVISCSTGSTCNSADPSNFNHCLVNSKNCYYEANIVGSDLPLFNIYPEIQL